MTNINLIQKTKEKVQRGGVYLTFFNSKRTGEIYMTHAFRRILSRECGISDERKESLITNRKRKKKVQHNLEGLDEIVFIDVLY